MLLNHRHRKSLKAAEGMNKKLVFAWAHEEERKKNQFYQKGVCSLNLRN